MTVWVSPRGSARHDVRVKVNTSHGDQMNIANTAVVGVRPSPHVVAAHLSPDDQRSVFEWISLKRLMYEGPVRLNEVYKTGTQR